MSNFQFLHKEWPQIFEIAKEAEDMANIKARLTMRDFMDSLRSSGVDTGGPPALNQNDRKTFADQLDKILTQQAKQS